MATKTSAPALESEPQPSSEPALSQEGLAVVTSEQMRTLLELARTSFEMLQVKYQAVADAQESERKLVLEMLAKLEALFSMQQDQLAQQDELLEKLLTETAAIIKFHEQLAIEAQQSQATITR